jgi:hypothetical protein
MENESNKELMGTKSSLKNIVEESEISTAIITESDLAFVARILPMCPLDNYPDLSIIEIEKVYPSGIIRTEINNVLGTPLSLIETINKQLIEWYTEDEQITNEILERELNQTKKKRKPKPLSE